MDAVTLLASQIYPGYPQVLPLSRYQQIVGPCNAAMIQAECTTVPRAAMWLAQDGAESGSFRWKKELASGEAYNWRDDLGNDEQGDGPRYKGRGWIELTGRTHYRNISLWAYDKGYVPTRTYFLDNPDALAQDKFAFLTAVYYWTVARDMNGYADRHDIYGGTVAVNGGTNNLDGRTKRWHKCLSLGVAILPTDQEFTMDAQSIAAFAALNKRLDVLDSRFIGSDGAPHTVESTVGHVTQGANYATHKGHLWTRLRRATDK